MTTRSLLSHRGLVPAALLSALAVAAAPDAHAAACPTSHPVYVAGSSAVKPFLKLLAAQLVQLATPINVIYQGQGSCTGVSYLSTTPSGTITGNASIWDSTATETTCTLDLAGNAVDIGVSDVYASTCTSTALPADVKDFYGPVQSMTFAVPATSVNNTISAEAAYLVYGFGAAGLVPNYNDNTLIFQRSASSGTQNMLATAIGVPAAKWQGVSNGTTGNMLTSLASSVSAGTQDHAIGILAMDAVEANAAAVKPLAYQHYGQSCAYWPSSTASSLDLANVRDGHYMVWGPLHMLAHTTSGVIQNADVKAVVDILAGTAVPTFDLIKAEAKAGVVPDCAMRVTRSSEIGALSSYMPAKSCECKFVFEATGTAPSSCKTCNTANGNADCASTPSTPICNYGYCEVQ